MRLIFGMLLGIALTVAFAYIHDTSGPLQAADGDAPVARETLVNWDVAAARWNDFTAGVTSLGQDVQRGWTRVAQQL